METYERIRQAFQGVIGENSWGSETIRVTAAPLTPEEAIGNPEERDYPLLKGKERIVEARFRGAIGHAFTDMYGNFSRALDEIATMTLHNNFRRAIFVSSLNAILRYLKRVDRTVHCRDQAPPRCSQELVAYIGRHFGYPRIAMVGFQPRMVEALAGEFDIRVTDMDADNIGQTRFGLVVGSTEKTEENVAWSDLCLVTGSSITNGTLPGFLIEKPTIFYGVSIAGAASLLNLRRFCPFGQ